MKDLHYDDRGLIPGIVQHAVTAQVLMLAYLNEESIARTRETGLVTFWSRSRDELWQKGETSGDTLSLVSMAADCDGDALLITALPSGPTCHTGKVTCFDDHTEQGLAWLEQLWDVIASRAVERPDGSYTTTLLDGGVEAVGRKVTEEATEVLLAAKDHAAGGPADRLAEESADLVYHLLVLLAERDMPPADMIDVLRARSS